MKKFFARLLGSLPKRIVAGAIIGLAFALPVAVSAASTVTIEGALGVANVTAGDTQYADSVNASYNQVVKVEVYYHNKELPDSGKIADNLRVKINMPTNPGTVQNIVGTISADNSNTVNDHVTVNLDRSDAYLQYIPGSAVWRHNIGTNTNIDYVNTDISDAVVNGGQGLVLENEKPCYNFSATVTVLARVMVPGVKIVKEVQNVGQSNQWSNSNTANPGSVLDYMIEYTNTGNTKEDNVVIRDNLPKGLTLVPNTTTVYTSINPNGLLDKSNDIANGGLNLGDYEPGAGLYVTFHVQVPDASKLACGENTFSNVGVAQPQGMSEYYNIANTTVNNQCATPDQPSYACTAFNVQQEANQMVKVTDFKTTQSGGATFTNVVIDWGDQSTPLTTNSPIGQTYTYAKPGSYPITATAHFSVNGQDKEAACQAQTVDFAAPSTPATPTTTAKPTELVNTGPGNVLELFAAATAAGFVGYRLFLSRRLARR